VNEAPLRRLTGGCGLAVGALTLLLIPLYFIYSGPPPASNVLTRNLISIVLCGFVLVFLVGLAQLLRGAASDPPPALAVEVFHGAGLAFVVVSLAARALEVGGVLAVSDGSVDPTIDGPLAHGAMLLHGSIARMLTAVLLGAAGYAIARTRLLPRWAARAAYVIAAVNLAFVPSLYFGTDATQFYSAVGWGNTALTGSLISYWTLAVGIALLRSHPEPTAP
jgi:hypothetical protein